VQVGFELTIQALFAFKLLLSQLQLFRDLRLSLLEVVHCEPVDFLLGLLAISQLDDVSLEQFPVDLEPLKLLLQT